MLEQIKHPLKSLESVVSEMPVGDSCQKFYGAWRLAEGIVWSITENTREAHVEELKQLDGKRLLSLVNWLREFEDDRYLVEQTEAAVTAAHPELKAILNQ